VKQATIDLEQVIIEKHPMVDANYRKKVSDACANLRYLNQHGYLVDIMELFFGKKSLNLNRLCLSHPQFQE